MIVGNGLIATAFSKYKDDPNVVIFASGVSNSKETEKAAFEKEINLLKNTIEAHPESLLVYFSTTSIEDHSLQDKMYVKHKIYIESLIQKTTNFYLILRLSNLVGTTKNPFTVVNFFVNQIKQQTLFTLWEHAFRNLIDIEDVCAISETIINEKMLQNSIVNIIFPENISVINMVDLIAEHIDQNANYSLLPFGENFKVVPPEVINQYFKGYENAETYFKTLLKKYIH